MMQIIYSLPPVMTALLLATLAVVTFIRSRKHMAHRLFALLCLLGCLLNVDIIIQLNVSSRESALRSSRWLHLFHPFLLPLFIHFFHAYLNISARRWLIGVAYLWALILAACSQGDLVVASMARFAFGFAGQGGRLYPMMALGAAFASFYNLIILLRAIEREKRSVQKNKLKYILAGFVILGLLTCLNLLVRFGYPIYPPGNFGFVPLIIFAAGIFKHDLLDMGLLIRKSLLYSVMTALLTLIYASIIIMIQRAFQASRLSDSFLFPMVFFAIIVFVFGPLKSRVQSIIDQLFAKGRYDYQQTIKQASETIASVLDYEKITLLLQETIIDAMQVAHCALYLRSENGGRYDLFANAGAGIAMDDAMAVSADAPLICCLGNTRAPLIRQQRLASKRAGRKDPVLSALDEMRAAVVLPLVFKDRLNGVIVLGEKRSGDLYSKEDLDLLETLGHQSAVALENVRAYEALNELNQNLESKVAERTRDLEQALLEKERTQERLVRSESLASLGQLVAGVAHELNNPLASVTSLLQSTSEDLAAWQEGQVPDEEMIDDLHFADKELSRARSIVSSLLGLSRQSQTYEEHVDLAVVVKDALRVLKNQHKGGHLRIHTRFDPDLPEIKGNFANLGQVVINIINNAVQAVDPSNGEISLSTLYERGSRRVTFRCQDNGPGIDDAIRKDIFKPFFTTKPVGAGTGLGLYICYEIVTKHGGTIDLQPAGTLGTVAIVRLPVCDSSRPNLEECVEGQIG